MWRVVLTAASMVLGGILGFRLFLPPPPPPDEYVCGLAVMPAMFLGFPAGMVVGGLLSHVLVRAIQHEARPEPKSCKQPINLREWEL